MAVFDNFEWSVRLFTRKYKKDYISSYFFGRKKTSNYGC